MRIGVDACCWTNKRGFGRFTRDLLKALIALDNENDYVFFVDNHTAIANDLPDGINVVVAPTRVSPLDAASASGRRSLGDMWAITSKVRRDNLHLFFFPAIYSYYPILNRTKIMVTIHDMTPERYPQAVFPNKKLRFFWKLKEFLAIRQAHRILTVSEYSKREILKFSNVSESRISVISEAPNSVFKRLPHDAEMIRTLQLFQIDPSERFLIYVGGISPHKNLRTLVEAYFQLTYDPLFFDVKLVLVGDYQHDSFYSDHPTLQLLINKHQLEKKVIFTGFVEDKDLAYLYNAASLLVFPSLQEGFGLPAVEAMACGTPVAASNAGSLPEILGDVGKFFNPHSPEQMVDLIKIILSDDNMREQMSRRGLIRAKQFSWDRAASDLLSIFHDLVKE